MGTYHHKPHYTNCADIVNEDETVRLTLAFKPGTYSVRVERWESREAGAMEQVMVCTIGAAQHEVSNDKTRPLADRYIEMLRKQYAVIHRRSRQHMEPLVAGFDSITSKKRQTLSERCASMNDEDDVVH